MADKDVDKIRVELLTLAAAGSMSGGVAKELIEPLKEIREGLGTVIEKLDAHLLASQGPNPYPWDETKALRERVAQLYLESRRVSRLTSDLANAINTFGKKEEWVNVNQLVEIAINLTRHQIDSRVELFIDFGTQADVLVVPGTLILVIARFISICARSASGVLSAAVSVKTRPEDSGVKIYIADSGSGCPEEAENTNDIAQYVSDKMKGRYVGRSIKGEGSVFELWIPKEL